MNIPAFNEKELEVVGQSFGMFGAVPVFNFPVDVADAYVSAVRDRKPVW